MIQGGTTVGDKNEPEKPERPPEFKTEPVRREDRSSKEFSHSDKPDPRQGDGGRRKR
jgi:hypothetical protein